MKFSISTRAHVLACLSCVAATLSAEEPSPSPLHFDRMPLENVARVLSARYRLPIRIEANAAAPISGDFTLLAPAQGIGEAARQAKLAAMPLGPQPRSGYRIGLPTAKPAANETSDSVARQRADLARKRAKLLADLQRLSR